MRILLGGVMVCLLWRSAEGMAAAEDACHLFVTSVLPGLFPYMVLSLMLVSRFGGRLPLWGVVLLGWGGGSPTGARLLRMTAHPRHQRVGMSLATATMSPMFLFGTVGMWLRSSRAGAALLVSVLVSGALTGWMASRFVRDEGAYSPSAGVDAAPLSFGSAIDQASRTMLLICGTMVMWRVFASLLAGVVPQGLLLPLTTLLEVTTGASAIAQLPLPLALRTALIAGATGFGGMAVLMQNRAVGDAPLSLPAQGAWQVVHGLLSFLIALGMMWRW